VKCSTCSSSSPSSESLLNTGYSFQCDGITRFQFVRVRTSVPQRVSLTAYSYFANAARNVFHTSTSSSFFDSFTAVLPSTFSLIWDFKVSQTVSIRQQNQERIHNSPHCSPTPEHQPILSPPDSGSSRGNCFYLQSQYLPLQLHAQTSPTLPSTLLLSFPHP
jgi:hypothetical protein